MSKIIFADSFNLTNEAEEDIKKLGQVFSLSLQEREKLVSESRDADIIIAEYALIDREIIENAEFLSGIVVYGVGVNHIDLTAASRKGIPVVNCKGGNAEGVAELAISLMLECLRKTGQSNAFVRSGKWNSADSASLPSWMNGRELKGKNLGILGAGTIGTRVGELGEAFGMRVIVSAGRKNTHSRFKWVPVEELLSDSDIVSVNLPLVPETEGLLSRERLALMKSGSLIIITSRGGIVDENALAEMLCSGHLSGAGIDVFREEPLPPDSPLLSAPNAVLTPHMGGSTLESVENISRIIAASCKLLIEGKKPPTTVNLEMLQYYGH